MLKKFIVFILVLQTFVFAVPTSHTYAKETLGASKSLLQENSKVYFGTIAGFERLHEFSNDWVSGTDALWKLTLSKEIKSQKELDKLLKTFNIKYKKIKKTEKTQKAISIAAQINTINVLYRMGFMNRVYAQDKINKVVQGLKTTWKFTYAGFDGDIIHLIISKTIDYKGNTVDAKVEYIYKDLIQFLKKQTEKIKNKKLQEKQEIQGL